MDDSPDKVVPLRPNQGPRVGANEVVVDTFSHHGTRVVIVQNRLTKRFTAKFEYAKPVPFTATSLRANDARRKAIKLIDKLHGK